MEHHSNIVPWQLLCREVGAELEYVEVTDDGLLDLDSLDAGLARGPKLVAVAHVSNVLGTVNPIAEIARRAHDAGALVLVDGAQAAPHYRIDVRELGVDFYGFTGHKLYGPTGVGVLYGRRELLEEMPPFLGGGDMISSVDFQESRWNSLPWKFEAGTSPFTEAAGLGTAVEWFAALGTENVIAHERDLVAYALERLTEVPGLRVLGPADRRRPPRHRDLVRDRGGPPARRGRDRRPRQHLHPRRPPLRAAADAPPGRAGHLARVVRRPQLAGRRRQAGRVARDGPLYLRALGAGHGRRLSRVHPRSLQAPPQLG